MGIRKSLIIVGLFFAIFVSASVGSAATGITGDEETHYFRGKVLSVEEVEEEGDFAGVEQLLEVQLTSGPMKGEIVSIKNYYVPGDQLFNMLIEDGKEVIVAARGDIENPEDIYLQDLSRERGIYYLLAVFVVLLLLIGKSKGLKTIVTLVITGSLIVLVLLPLLLQGYSPIFTAVVVAAAAIILTLLIIGGFNVKSFSAIIGTVAGVIVAGLMALWAGSVSSLTGFSTQEAQMLYYMDYGLDIRGLLFAGIIIGSLGAITDVGMSVASAAAEIKEANPKIKINEITMGALNVGRDVMGTMANTLILAYAGAAIPLLLLVKGYEMDWMMIVNMDLIATEFIRGIAGSIGLAVAVPITAVISGILLSKANPRRR